MYDYHVSDEQDHDSEHAALRLWLDKQAKKNGADRATDTAAARGQSNPIKVQRQNVKGYKCQILLRNFLQGRGLLYDETDILAKKQQAYPPDLIGAGLSPLHVKTWVDETKPLSWVVEVPNLDFWKGVGVGLSYDDVTHVLTVHWIAHGSIAMRAMDVMQAPQLRQSKRAIYWQRQPTTLSFQHHRTFLPLSDQMSEFMTLQQLVRN